MKVLRAPAMWRIWGQHYYTVTRLPRYWLALLECRRAGHRWNARSCVGTSAERRGCTRCWRSERVAVSQTPDSEGSVG